MTTSQDGTKLVFRSTSLAIEINRRNISAIHQTLQSLPPRSLHTPETLREAIGHCEITPSIPIRMADSQTIPTNGLSLPLLLDQLQCGTNIGSIHYPPRRTQVLDTLAHIINTLPLTDNRTNISDHMETYAKIIQENPNASTFKHKINVSMSALSTLLDDGMQHPHQLWHTDPEPRETPPAPPKTTVPTPAPWLTLHTTAEDSSLTIRKFLLISAREETHIGRQDSSYFFITEAIEDLTMQIDWMISNIADHILQHPPTLDDLPHMTTYPRLTLQHKLQVQHMNQVIYIKDKRIKSIQKKCKRVPQHLLFTKIMEILETRPYIGCLHMPNPRLSETIPANGLCSAYAMDYITHSTDGITRPSSFPNVSRTKAMLTTIQYTVPESDGRETIGLMAKALSITRPSFPRIRWPSLSLVHIWSNTLSPTALWSSDTHLPLEWLTLTNIPRAHPAPHSAQSFWTPHDLTKLTGAKHIALDQSHFFPTAFNSDMISTMIYSLAIALADHITGDLSSRRQHAAPPSLQNTQPDHDADNTDHTEQFKNVHELALTNTTITQGRVHFSTELCTYSDLPRPQVHPALTLYCPDVDQPPRIKNPPRFRRKAQDTNTLSKEDTIIYPPTEDRKYYTHSKVLHELDLVLIGANESYDGAFARRDTEVETDVAIYSECAPGNRPITHPSDPDITNGDYAISIKSNGYWYEADAFMVASCPGRFFDEADTEEEENCRFQVKKGVIWITTTKYVPRYGQYLTRYGHIYWCHLKWPLPLLLKMYDKYKHTLNKQDMDKWKLLIKTKKSMVAKERRYLPHRGILKYPTTHMSQTRSNGSNFVTPATNRLRKYTQKKHKKKVQRGQVAPLRPIPTLFRESERPQFHPTDWTHSFPPITQMTQKPKVHANLTIMSFSCQGKLFSTGGLINNTIDHFLSHVGELMLSHQVDILWLNDARFTTGSLDAHLHTLSKILPNCRVFQFPTSYVHTGSRCQSFNRMGGAICIVTHAWHGYSALSIPDPTGSGLVNAIDFRAGPHHFRTINTYMVPTTTLNGPATIYSRLMKYIQGSTGPSWARKMSPAQYQYSYLQILVDTATQQEATTIISGDWNASLMQSDGKSPTRLIQFKSNNQMQTPLQDTLHHYPGYHTWRSPTQRQKCTIIDHVLHTPLPPHMEIALVGTIHDEETNTLSDHLPIWITISLLLPVKIPAIWNPQPTMTYPDLDRQNKPELQEYNKHLSRRIKQTLSAKFRNYQTNSPTKDAISPQNSASGLAAILRHSVLSVHEKKDGLNKAVKMNIGHKCQRTRSNFKNGYSPAMRQLQTYIYFYQNLISSAFPSGNMKWKDPWTTTSYQRLLTKWLKQWKHRHHILLNKITPFSPAALLPHPSHLEQKNFHTITLRYIRSQIKKVKDCLHGTLRRDMRDKINPIIKKRDKLWKQRQLSQLIEQLSGRGRGQLDLQSLPCPILGQMTDQNQIKDTLHDYFKEWHAIPPGLDPAADHLARHPTWWQNLLTYEDKGDPQLLHKKSKIPSELQDGLRRACAVKVTAPVQDKIHTAVNERVTFNEFNSSLNDMANGGAAGVSKVTANMLKSWDLPTRQLVHAHMENIWITRSTPKWFKDKLIKLAPKIPGNTQLKYMRPISLYETLRKAWTTIIGKRIHLAWHENDVLHPKQYGYRLDQGTHMALFSVLNQIEGANHSKSTKHATFWDIKRAFDSIPRNIQKLAWVRLGVPKDVAEWFVNLDDGGLSFISSPHYNLNSKIKTPDQMMGRDTHFTGAPELGYQAERGIGQGESASSLMWTALYDILLEWIDPTNYHLHESETRLDYSDEDAAGACPSAYADDLCTITAGPRAEYMQQTVATWISAFCAFTGMVMHPAKIYSTILGPIPSKYTTLSRDDLQPSEDNTKLVIHDLNWTPIQCPIFPYLKTMKYLGVQLDLRDFQHSDSHKKTLDIINTHLSHLLVQPGSPGAKIDYILFKLIPIVMNTAICANWTLNQYRELDTPFSKTYKLLLSLPRTFPSAILYLPRSMMGVGLPRFSDKAQVMKWEALIRCLAVRGDPAQSVNDFLDRLPPSTTSTKDHLKTLSSPAHWPPQRRYTARSMIEWFDQSGVSPCVRTQQESDPSQSIQDFAEHHRLWPSDWYGEEDNENLPPVHLIATDGSFTQKILQTS